MFDSSLTRFSTFGCIHSEQWYSGWIYSVVYSNIFIGKIQIFKGINQVVIHFVKGDMNSWICIILLLSLSTAILVVDFYFSAHRFHVFHSPEHVTLDGKFWRKKTRCQQVMNIQWKTKQQTEMQEHILSKIRNYCKPISCVVTVTCNIILV